MSSSNDPPTQAPRPSPPSPSTLFKDAVSTLPKDKALVFTNFLRFHRTPQYPSAIPENLTTNISESDFSSLLNDTSISGAVVYWTRYFPVYHQATREILGDEADSLQRVIYKGAPLMLLRFAKEDRMSSWLPPSSPATGSGSASETKPVADIGSTSSNNYWHAVVMTRVASWDVVARISENELYKTLGTFHRDAAVEDDELFVSCAIEGFEM